MAGRDKKRMGAGVLALSAAVVAAIAGFEGYSSKAYIPVPGDVPTLGHGTTKHPDGTPVKMGDTTTPARAMELLRHDANRFAKAVQRCSPVPMYQHEYDAFVSLTYNIGEGAFCGSTAAKLLRAGDYAGACKQILRWNKMDGKVLPGLTNRRKAEYKMCMGESK